MLRAHTSCYCQHNACIPPPVSDQTSPRGDQSHACTKQSQAKQLHTFYTLLELRVPLPLTARRGFVAAVASGSVTAGAVAAACGGAAESAMPRLTEPKAGAVRALPCVSLAPADLSGTDRGRRAPVTALRAPPPQPDTTEAPHSTRLGTRAKRAPVLEALKSMRGLDGQAAIDRDPRQINLCC